MLQCPFAWGGPVSVGRMRVLPEHFRVIETLDVSFDAEGEFDWVYIEKTGLTTPEAADLLKGFSGARDISYSGLKDKHAVTRQWFSLHMLGAASADWSAFSDSRIKVLRSERHRRKLRRGTHRYNHFELVLSGVTLAQLEQRISTLAQRGVPNYFGEQRFGRHGENIEAAQRWLLGGGKVSRFKRGLWLSVVRAQLFNAVLAGRVAAGNWNTALAGDLFALGDGNSVFQDVLCEELAHRLETGEIHPTGPLPGKVGRTAPVNAAADCENRLLEPYAPVVAALVKRGVEAARRPLRVIPKGLAAEPADEGVRLAFSLPRGCFATALVRELIDYSE